MNIFLLNLMVKLTLQMLRNRNHFPLKNGPFHLTFLLKFIFQFYISMMTGLYFFVDNGWSTRHHLGHNNRSDTTIKLSSLSSCHIPKENFSHIC